MADPDFSQFKLAVKGHSFEDFTEGQVFVHHWGRTINAGDNSLFTTATLSYCPLYFNVEYAHAHGHSDVVVNPMLVVCTVVGMSVEDLSEAGGPFLGINGLKFHRAVYPGDTLSARSTVVVYSSYRSVTGSQAPRAGCVPVRVPTRARPSCRIEQDRR